MVGRGIFDGRSSHQVGQRTFGTQDKCFVGHWALVVNQAEEIADYIGKRLVELKVPPGTGNHFAVKTDLDRSPGPAHTG